MADCDTCRRSHRVRVGRPLESSDGRWRCQRQADSFAPGVEMKSMNMHTYVNFGGKCKEAFRFYEEHLGGDIKMMMTHAEVPNQTGVQPEWKDAVLHARISVGGTELWAADIPSAEPMRSAYLSLSVSGDAEAERIF